MAGLEYLDLAEQLCSEVCIELQYFRTTTSTSVRTSNDFLSEGYKAIGTMPPESTCFKLFASKSASLLNDYSTK
jgi:hypothetical protein